MAFVDVGPSVDTVDPSYPTYLCLELPGQPWDQPWGVTPYEVLPSRLNRLLYGNLTLSESTSENGSEDYGSSGSGDVVELNGSPSSNVAIRPPPGLSQDIGEVAKVYPSHSFGTSFAIIFKGYDPEKHAAFELVPRLIGRNGDNMKKIHDQTGARVIVCGRGSGWIEVKSPHGYFERDEPLQLAVSRRSMKIREAASQGWFKETMVLVKGIAQHFRRFCRQQKLDCVELYVVQEMTLWEDGLRAAYPSVSQCWAMMRL
ncbi:unnamed protein product [Symbiodinium natans]|uniref:KHDC4/BBP-like KH-domain type I domain-containing protein n=1 Tax=Symbiodinium natans TaxID=878477 RepID=A0A812TCA4_9DINO|nr:unnamed protein product [Symbiodinium natans]